MRCVLYKNGEYVNTIIADEDFASSYCRKNGLTYTIEPEEIIEPPVIEPEVPIDEILSTMMQFDDD